MENSGSGDRQRDRAPDLSTGSPRGGWASRLLPLLMGILKGLIDNHAVLPTVITVIAGTLLTGRVQRGNRERELAVLAYRDYADAELKTSTAVFEIVGRYAATSENLIELSKHSLLVKSDTQTSDLRKQILADYNSSQQEWRNARYRIELLLRHYHRNGAAVQANWLSLVDRLSELNSCALAWYRSHTDVTDENARIACSDKKRLLRSAFDGFTAALDTDRRQMWEMLDLRLR